MKNNEHNDSIEYEKAMRRLHPEEPIDWNEAFEAARK